MPKNRYLICIHDNDEEYHASNDERWIQLIVDIPL